MKMRHFYITLLLVAVFLAGAALIMPAIGTAQNQQTVPPQSGMTGMPVMMQSCPMQVTGAEVSILDTKDRIALTITTTSGDVADLRNRVERMANMHSSEAMHGNMMPFTAAYEEVPNGARLTLVPKDSQKLPEFRNIVRQDAEQMKNHDCSMMQGMMGAMKKTEPPAKPDTTPKSDKDDHSAHHPSEEKK
jgi:hypothetical protein